mmetsp:Transcript_16516/g.29457  ORF Transcript_16516/g.29457 Transcript_16516/m.29457 type:complete len:107 (+) Transcript_16516:640-960(+)
MITSGNLQHAHQFHAPFRFHLTPKSVCLHDPTVDFAIALAERCAELLVDRSSSSIGALRATRRVCLDSLIQSPEPCDCTPFEVLVASSLYQPALAARTPRSSPRVH